MGDDVTEWDNPVHVERKCPLCGATRTRFVDVYSDGDEVVECSFGRQKCNGCELSCKHWDAIDALTAENAELRKRVEDLEGSFKNMRRYSAVQGRLDDGEELVGLAYYGSIWGPCADPKYEMYELAESVEKWLHEEIDAALTQRKEGSET